MRLLDRLACWFYGHIWKFNGGNPVCAHCGKYQYKTPRYILPAKGWTLKGRK